MLTPDADPAPGGRKEDPVRSIPPKRVAQLDSLFERLYLAAQEPQLIDILPAI